MDILNTNSASSFRPLPVGHTYFVFESDFNVYQRLLIFVAVSVVVFVQHDSLFFVQHFTRFVHPKGVVVNLASPDVS